VAGDSGSRLNVRWEKLKNMIKSITLRLTLASLSVVICTLSAGGLASAFTPSMLKLSGKLHSASSFDQIGWRVGCSEKWVVSTAPIDDSVAGVSAAGAAYIYSATTGRFVRKIRPADLASGDGFGSALAVCGDFALIAAPGQGDGVGYLCNLATGAVVRKFASPTAGSDFAGSVALNADFAVFGASGEDGGDGAVYVYKLATLEAPLRIAAPAPASGSAFGSEVAVSSDQVVVSAVTSDLGAPDAGAVFIFSFAGNFLTSITEAVPATGNNFGSSLVVSGKDVIIGASQAAGGAGSVLRSSIDGNVFFPTFLAAEVEPGDNFGASMAVSGNVLIIGASGDDDAGTDAGAVYFFDRLSGQRLRKMYMPGSQNNSFFGNSVSFCGNQAVIGALFASDIAAASGSAYLCRPIVGGTALTSVARAGDSAPSTQNAEFAKFSNAFVNVDEAVLIQASLSGPGGAGVSGVWSTLRNVNSLDVLLRTKLNLDAMPRPNFVGVTPTPLGTPTFGGGDYGLVLSTLRGPGVNGLNNKALFVSDSGGTDIVPILRTGDDIGFGEILHNVVDVAQSGTADDHIMAAITKRLKVAGVDATKDSAILVMNGLGNRTAAFEEGTSAPGGGAFGQFSGRAASATLSAGAFSAFLIPTVGAAPMPALFRGEFGGPSAKLAEKGQQAADCDIDVVYSSFIAESMQNFTTYFKAIITGPGVTKTNNTGLWHDSGGLLARTGSEIEPGLSVSVIEKFWPISESAVIFQVVLKGNKVTSANNRALYVWIFGTGVTRLMRTGSHADPEFGQATIASIQEVGVAVGSGYYTILASLKGTSAATNQAVWAGNIHEIVSVAKSSLGLPRPLLRKGLTVLAPSGQTTTIKSIALSRTTAANGAGNVGKAMTLTGLGKTVLMLEFTNKAKEVMLLTP